MKDTKELAGFLGVSLNSVFEILKDKKIGLEDIQHVLKPIFSAQPAFEGFGNIGAENGAASIPERDLLNRAFQEPMTGVPLDRADNFTRIFGGIFAAWREGYNIGHAEARAELIEQLRSGSLQIGDLLEQE